MTSVLRRPPYIKREGLSLERHRELGAELSALRDRLLHIGIEVANSYPKASRVSRRALRIHKPLDDLRVDLENMLARDYPDGFEVAVYYPHVNDSRRVP